MLEKYILPKISVEWTLKCHRLWDIQKRPMANSISFMKLSEHGSHQPRPFQFSGQKWLVHYRRNQIELKKTKRKTIHKLHQFQSIFFTKDGVTAVTAVFCTFVTVQKNPNYLEMTSCSMNLIKNQSQNS